MSQTLLSQVGGSLWCEGLDAELPTLVPGARDALGNVGDVELLTYCTPTNGKINCPAAWWTDAGLAAFFALPGFGGIAPPGYVGGKEQVVCTFWEAVQDEWWHDCVIRVNWRHDVWKPPARLMERLMYDVRGWTKLSDAERDEIQENVRRSLAAASRRLDAIVNPRHTVAVPGDSTSSGSSQTAGNALASSRLVGAGGFEPPFPTKPHEHRDGEQPPVDSPLRDAQERA